MSTLLSVILLAAIALFGAGRRFYRLRRSRPAVIVISGGWLYIAAGAALGPFGLRAVASDDIMSLSPLIAVALGWVGVMIGLQLRVSVLRTLPRVVHRVSAWDSLISIAVFTGIGAIGLAFWAPGAAPAALLPAAAVIGAASIGWAMETRSLHDAQAPSDDALASLLRAVGALGAIASIVVAGLLVAAAVRDVDGAAVIDARSFAVRVLLATLMALAVAIIGRHAAAVAASDRPDLLTVFLGLIALTAGAATAIGFSPILASLFAGAVIANLSGAQLRRFERFILEAEHAIAAILCLLAGVMLDPRIGAVGLLLALGISAARLVIKPAIVRLANRRAAPGPASHSLLALAPARQSPIAIPIALTVVLAEPSPFHQRILTVVALSGLFAAVPLIFLAARRPGATTTPSAVAPTPAPSGPPAQATP